MKLLIINFEMNPNSKVLAWQYKVVLELAKTYEKIVVFTESMSDDLVIPNHVEVHQLPKLFQGPLRLTGIKWLMNFPLFQICLQNRFDACFIHMNMEWSYRLRPVLRFFKIPTLIWYAHGSISNRLKLAHYFADKIISSSPEGFRLPSKKLQIVGQGIDTALFQVPDPVRFPVQARNDILYVGRVSRRKRIDLLIDSFIELKKLSSDEPIRLVLAGGTVSSLDEKYAESLKERVRNAGLESSVVFLGHTPLEKVPQLYETAFMHLNLSETGSMDKTVLEALACGCPALTSNVAFKTLFKDQPRYFLEDPAPTIVAKRILEIYSDHRAGRLNPQNFRDLIVDHHDLKSYIRKIIQAIESISRHE